MGDVSQVVMVMVVNHCDDIYLGWSLMMMMICTACKLQWAAVGVKGVEPKVHLATKTKCQSGRRDDR